MPIIIEDEKRVAALQEISKNLELTKQLNEALSAMSSCAPVITLQPDKGKPIKLELGAENESHAIADLLTKRKNELIRIIRRDTAKHRIALSDDEEAILSVPEKKSDTKKLSSKSTKKSEEEE